MAEKEKNPFGGLKLAAQKGLASIDVEALKEKAAEASGILKEKAVEVKDAAVAAKDEIADKITELDRMLQGVVTEYNDAYTIMNDKDLDCYDRWDDGISWNEGQLNRKELEHICKCYATHVICVHNEYSLPDLLRLNDFWVEVQFKCQHFIFQKGYD